MKYLNINTAVLMLFSTCYCFQACTSSSSFVENHAKFMEGNHKTAENEVNEKDIDFSLLSQLDSTELHTLLNSYLSIKEALVYAKSIEAQREADRLMGFLGQRKENKPLQTMKSSLRHIAETDDIVHQREYFDGLSSWMYRLLKISEKPYGTLYQQYCPKALSNKGAYWLSTSSVIENPYFNEKHLSCGEISETLTDLGK